MQRVRVVHRHADLEAVLSMRTDPDCHRKHQWVTDAPVVVLTCAALEHAPLHDAVLEHVEADLNVTTRVPLRDRLTPASAGLRQVTTVQPFEVHGVHAVLHDLQPVAGHDSASDVAQHAGPDEQIVGRERRRRRRPQIREHEPTKLPDRIGRRRGACDQPLGRAQGARGYAPARGVEAPAVVGALQGGRVGETVRQRRPAMWAPGVEQAERARRGPEQREVLAEDTDRQRGAGGTSTLPATGSQYRQRRPPIGVPGPTLVRVSCCSAVSTISERYCDQAYVGS